MQQPGIPTCLCYRLHGLAGARRRPGVGSISPTLPSPSAPSIRGLLSWSNLWLYIVAELLGGPRRRSSSKRLTHPAGRDRIDGGPVTAEPKVRSDVAGEIAGFFLSLPLACINGRLMHAVQVNRRSGEIDRLAASTHAHLSGSVMAVAGLARRLRGMRTACAAGS
jgi:hypothetical protein